MVRRYGHSGPAAAPALCSDDPPPPATFADIPMTRRQGIHQRACGHEKRLEHRDVSGPVVPALLPPAALFEEGRGVAAHLHLVERVVPAYFELVCGKGRSWRDSTEVRAGRARSVNRPSRI